MIRRDFVKRLSALAALPLVPAFLRRAPSPPPVATEAAEATHWVTFRANPDTAWHRYTYQYRAGEPVKFWVDGVQVDHNPIQFVDSQWIR